MGKNIKNKVKYRLLVTLDDDKKPSRDFPWEGEDVNSPELRSKYCLWLNYMGSGNCNGTKINGSKLEEGVKVTGVSVQVSDRKNELGKRVWNDYEYMESVHQPIRYM